MVVEWACLAREHERGKAWSGNWPVPMTHSDPHMTQETPSLPSPETAQCFCAIQGRATDRARKISSFACCCNTR